MMQAHILLDIELFMSDADKNNRLFFPRSVCIDMFCPLVSRAA
jgi:hypothetical protein